MIVGASAKLPVILAIGLLDRKIVDAGNAKPHQAVLVEFPVLVAVAAEPMTAVVVPFIGEANGDAVLAESPDFLDQAVVELAGMPRSPRDLGETPRGCASDCRLCRRARPERDRVCSRHLLPDVSSQ